MQESFTVKLGEADFPTKMYGGYVYPAGKYQALVITLGSGQGANWWCVLFPPLCFLDFEHGDAVKTKNNHDQTTKTAAGQKQAAFQKPKDDDKKEQTAQNIKDAGTKTNQQSDSDDEQDGEKTGESPFLLCGYLFRTHSCYRRIVHIKGAKLVTCPLNWGKRRTCKQFSVNKCEKMHRNQ
ncbi:stage II sporulation protein R [Terrilactibacillus sp. S3-3]|nr:stage II sporulation protein R [Terrilactibacillus sp. S3-3]